MGWIALLHTKLLMGERGKNALGASALLLACLGVTGLFLWWPPDGRFSRGLKIDWRGRRAKLVFDMHRAFGVYSLLFLLIAALTGVSLVFNNAVMGMTDFLTASPPRRPPPLSRPPGETAATPPPPVPVDDLLQEADRLLSGPTTWITLPRTPEAALVIRKKMPGDLNPNGKSFVYFDQYSHEVLRAEDSSSAAAAPASTMRFTPCIQASWEDCPPASSRRSSASCRCSCSSPAMSCGETGAGREPAKAPPEAGESARPLRPGK